tara:strand:+ start:4509 stop:5612 length:1104 start_codon:yes stop_codon:yes gene_type:complete
MILADSINSSKILKPLSFSILLLLFFLIFSFYPKKESHVPTDTIQVSSINGNTMGTTYTVSIKASDIKVDLLKNNIDSILKIINMSMSTYVPNSEISLFNSRTSNEQMQISKHFYNVLERSKYYYDLSDKKFDPTIGPLYNLWGFNGNRILEEPNHYQIDSAMNIVGMDNISFGVSDEAADYSYFISKKKDELKVEFNAIAKGYAVDVISNYLSNLGYKCHFVEIGGEIRATSDLSLWPIAIQNPYDLSKTLEPISLLNNSVATSGNYWNYIEYLDTGSRKTHIINPLTGYPLEAKNGMISSATVISDNCMDADALATILMLLDVDQGIQLINSINNTEAFVIYFEDSIMISRKSKGFEALRERGGN